MSLRKPPSHAKNRSTTQRRRYRRMQRPSLVRDFAVRLDRCGASSWMSTPLNAARSVSESYALSAMIRFGQHA